MKWTAKKLLWAAVQCSCGVISYFLCDFVSRGYFKEKQSLDYFYSRYHSVPVLQDRLRKVVRFSCPHASLERIGTSHRGFPIYMVRLGITSEVRPIRVLITAGMHGRERSTSIVALFAIEKFCAEFYNDIHQSSFDRVEVLVVPILNPDGQERSRLINASARKNLRPTGVGEKPCENFGVDLNRNWPTFWGLGNGTSSDPCHDQYQGPIPLSEPESLALAESMLSNPGIRAHVDVHSFGQFIYRGWAYKGSKIFYRGSDTDSEAKQRLLARALRMAIRAENNTDMIDIAANFATLSFTKRIQGGTLMDYMMEKQIPSVTVELGPRLTQANAASGYATNESDLVWRSREMFRGFETLYFAVDPLKHLPEYEDSELGIVFP